MIGDIKPTTLSFWKILVENGNVEKNKIKSNEEVRRGDIILNKVKKNPKNTSPDKAILRYTDLGV